MMEARPFGALGFLTLTRDILCAQTPSTTCILDRCVFDTDTE